MNAIVLAWVAVGAYVLLTIGLTIRGAMKTSSLESFAVGNRDIPPMFVGLSLTAQLTSVATFVVNPGLIYAFGVSGLLGLGLSAGLGIILGLIFFSARFRSMGATVQALTIPQWIGARYKSKGLRIFFAFLSFLLVTFAVLIVVAIARTMGILLNVNPNILISAVVLFVFAYVMLGGVNTHAYTNAIQAMIMLVVALVLILSNLSMFWSDPPLMKELADIQPTLATATNPYSLLFRNYFEVFVCNFLVGVAIVCQPHILSKALYLKEDSQVRQYLTVAILGGLVFVCVMVVGLYARVLFQPVNEVGSLFSMMSQAPVLKFDGIVPTYIFMNFSATVRVLIGIGILCAGLSTLEGILLALSAIISSDLFLTLTKPASDNPSKEEQEARGKKALMFARGMMIAVALLTIGLSMWQLAHPTAGSVAIFTQYGLYLLFTVSFFPLASGMFFPNVQRATITASVAVGFVVYFAVFFLKFTSMYNNPAFLATCSIISGWIVIAIGSIIQGKAKEEAEA